MMCWCATVLEPPSEPLLRGLQKEDKVGLRQANAVFPLPLYKGAACPPKRTNRPT